VEAGRKLAGSWQEAGRKVAGRWRAHTHTHTHTHTSPSSPSATLNASFGTSKVSSYLCGVCVCGVCASVSQPNRHRNQVLSGRYRTTYLLRSARPAPVARHRRARAQPASQITDNTGFPAKQENFSSGAACLLALMLFPRISYLSSPISRLTSHMTTYLFLDARVVHHTVYTLSWNTMLHFKICFVDVY
jgi:hypothetical protein